MCQAPGDESGDSLVFMGSWLWSLEGGGAGVHRWVKIAGSRAGVNDFKTHTSKMRFMVISRRFQSPNRSFWITVHYQRGNFVNICARLALHHQGSSSYCFVREVPEKVMTLNAGTV